MTWWLYMLADLLIFNVLNNFATEATISSFGCRFLIALPKVDGDFNEEVHFLLGTMANKIQVAITTNGREGGEMQASVTLRRSYVTRYVVDKVFTQKQDGSKITWTYEFNSIASFSLTVVMLQPRESVATFLAVPLNAWGKQYMATGHGHNPTFHLVTLEETDISLVFDGLYVEPIEFELLGTTYRLGSSVPKFRLDSRRSFMLSFCSFSNTTKMWTTVMRINSTEPIGVIYGNCKQSIMVCSEGFVPMFDANLEMIFPVSLMSTQYIFWFEPGVETDICVDGEDGLFVTVQNTLLPLKHGGSTSVTIRASGLVIAPQPFMAVVRTVQGCKKLADGVMKEQSSCLLLATQLFNVFYLWRSPVVGIIHKLILIVEPEYIKSTVLDDQSLPNNINWEHSGSRQNYSVGFLKIISGSHTVRSKVNRKFGCYIIGGNYAMRYANPVGFSDCVNRGTGSDKNVCMGGTDEEAYTEGLQHAQNAFRGIGSWEQWNGWTCTKEGVKIRTRGCEKNMACKGMYDDIADKPCTPSCAQKIGYRGNVILILIFIAVLKIRY